MMTSQTKLFIAAAMCVMLCYPVHLSVAQGKGLPPTAIKNGVVPDAKTAIKIADAVLVPIYGEDQIASERPFRAELVDGRWMITGVLHGGTFVFGGIAHVKISKSTGQIEELWHSK
jgi:hypothetical protein